MYVEINSSTNFLDGGKKSCENAEILRDSAESLYQGTNKHIALFLLYTSCEELEKAIFCLLVHYKHLNQEQINSVFKFHKLKIILFEKIFNDKIIGLNNGKFVLNGKPLKSSNLKKLEQENDPLWKKYKQEREGCLYVEPQGKNWYDPKSITDVEKRWSDTDTKWHGLNALYKSLKKNGLKDDFNIFSLVVIVQKGQNQKDTLIFNGTGKAMK